MQNFDLNGNEKVHIIGNEGQSPINTHARDAP